jgi:hypothetical protein
MATVTLSRYDCSADLVPAVCAACGRPAADRVSHAFTWRVPLRDADGLGDWLTSRTANVRLPLCPAHARHTRRKNRFLLFTLIPMLALMVIGLGPLIGLFPDLDPFMELAVAGSAGIVLFVWVGVLHLFFADKFTCEEITDRTVTLRGVDRQFRAAVEAGPAAGPTGPAGVDGGLPAATPGEVTLTEAEYQADRLPPVCPWCGSPATTRVPRRVRLFPQRLGCLLALPCLASLIFCPPLFILLIVLFGRRIDVPVPVCAEHETAWAAFDRIGGRLILPVWCLVATGLTVCAVLDRDHRWIYVGASVLVFLAILGLERVMSRGMVLVLQAEGSDMRIRNVHPVFAAALAEMRERERAERPPVERRFEDERDDYDDDVTEGRRRRWDRDEYDDSGEDRLQRPDAGRDRTVPDQRDAGCGYACGGPANHRDDRGSQLEGVGAAGAVIGLHYP